MQEFRPADVIDADTRLAESLQRDEPEALATLVSRYGRAVHAVTVDPDAVSHGSDSGHAAPVDVFVEAWHERGRLEAGADFAPWVGALTARKVGRRVDEISDTWSVAMAIDGIDPEHRSSLRAHHLERVPLPDSAVRAERRIRRRLAHLGDDASIDAALSAPQVWAEPDAELLSRVRSRLGFDHRSVGATATSESSTPASAEPAIDDEVGDDRPGLVARSLRPVLLGLAGAVVVLFVAVVALSAASGSPVPATFTEAMTPTGAIVDVEGGELTVTELDSGLRLDLDAQTLPRRAGDQFYEGVLVLQDGTELGAGSFNAGSDVSLSAGVPLDRVVEFQVVTRTLGTDAADVVLKLDVPQS